MTSRNFREASLLKIIQSPKSSLMKDMVEADVWADAPSYWKHHLSDNTNRRTICMTVSWYDELLTVQSKNNSPMIHLCEMVRHTPVFFLDEVFFLSTMKIFCQPCSECLRINAPRQGKPGLINEINVIEFMNITLNEFKKLINESQSGGCK